MSRQRLRVLLSALFLMGVACDSGSECLRPAESGRSNFLGTYSCHAIYRDVGFQQCFEGHEYKAICYAGDRNNELPTHCECWLDGELQDDRDCRPQAVQACDIVESRSYLESDEQARMLLQSLRECCEWPPFPAGG